MQRALVAIIVAIATMPIASPPIAAGEPTDAAQVYAAGVRDWNAGHIDDAIKNWEYVLKVKPDSGPTKDKLILALKRKIELLEKELADVRAALAKPDQPKTYRIEITEPRAAGPGPAAKVLPASSVASVADSPRGLRLIDLKIGRGTAQLDPSRPRNVTYYYNTAGGFLLNESGKPYQNVRIYLAYYGPRGVQFGGDVVLICSIAAHSRVPFMVAAGKGEVMTSFSVIKITAD
jgi:hypothetical protein